MRKLDEYGNGRASVISEMIKWCDKEIALIKSFSGETNSHKSAAMSGQIRAFTKTKQILVSKQNKLKDHNIHTRLDGRELIISKIKF